ncbi:unnamed protein product [Blepharisma stoltei]|uniref:Uncharacterized protein n=1 Tax=Blepharisma stoltei TaxID=1481888 RepID=A0AAU9IMM9_9CILI|nr:unnamed protein product [Blepharisma stoltei]
MDLELTIIWLAASTLIALGYIVYTQNDFIKLIHRKRAEKGQHAITDDGQSIDMPRKRQKLDESLSEEPEDEKIITKGFEESDERSLQVINSQNDTSVEDFVEEICQDTQVELPMKREYDLASSFNKKAEFYSHLKDDMPTQIQKLNESLARPNGRQLYIHSNFKDYSLYPFEEYYQCETQKEKNEKNYVYSQSFVRYSEEIDFSVQKHVDFNCFKNWKLKRKAELKKELEFEKPAIIPEEKSSKNKFRSDIGDISSPSLLSALYDKNEDVWSKANYNSYKSNSNIKEIVTKNSVSRKDIRKIDEGNKLAIKIDHKSTEDKTACWTPATPTFNRKNPINVEETCSADGLIKEAKTAASSEQETSKISKTFGSSAKFPSNDNSTEKSAASLNSSHSISPFSTHPQNSKLEDLKIKFALHQDAPSPFSGSYQFKDSIFSPLNPTSQASFVSNPLLTPK